MSRIDRAGIATIGTLLVITFGKDLLPYYRSSKMFGVELDFQEFMEIYGTQVFFIAAGLFMILVSIIKFKK